jgi:acetyl-CoA acetyltransferase
MEMACSLVRTREAAACIAFSFVPHFVEPDEMGVGPVAAVPRLLERQGLKIEDIDLRELSEAKRRAGHLLPREAWHRS